MNEITQFESAAMATRARASQSTMVEQSRAVAEVQAAVVVAQQRPRDVQSALKEMREVCGIQRLAEKAFFRFSRGGSQVNGESVHLARELARCWGNVVYGLAELSRNDAAGESEMMAFAWDMQTNARAQTAFIVPHQRDTKSGAKALTDMRDIYENNANMGARRLREQIFAVLPVWFREEAADICRDTLKNGGGIPLVQRIADCVEAFEAFGITRAQLEKKQGRKVDAFTAEDVAALGVVYRSIKNGETTKDDEFARDVIDPPTNADNFEKASAGKATPPADDRAATGGGGAALSPPPDPEAERAQDFLKEIAALETAMDVRAWGENTAVKTVMARWEKEQPELFKLVDDAVAARVK